MINAESKLLSRLVMGTGGASVQRCMDTLAPGEFFQYPREAQFVWTFWNEFNVLPEAQVFIEQFPDFPLEKSKAPLPFLVRSVREKVVGAQVEQFSGKLFRMIRDGEDPYQVASYIAENAPALYQRPLVSDGTKDWRDPEGKLERYESRKAGTSKNYRIPLPGLSLFIDHMQPGELLTMVALPGVGKTWIAALCAYSAVVEQGLRCILVSREVRAEDIQDRLDALGCGIGWTRFRRTMMEPEEEERYQTWVNRIAKHEVSLRIIGPDNIDFTLADLKESIREYQPDLVIVDGMHLLQSKGQSMVEQTYLRSRAFKQMMLAQNCMGIQTLHVSRSAEPKPGEKAIKIGGLGFSSWGAAPSQDTDYYVELVAPEGKDAASRLAVIEKSRNDKMGEARFWMNFDPMCFTGDIDAPGTRPLSVKGG